MTITTVRPDPKGRVSLGKLIPEGTTSFRVHRDKDDRIILEPQAEIPVRELWLWKNPEALAAVQEGLKQSAAGQTVYRGSFAAYAEDEDDAE